MKLRTPTLAAILLLAFVTVAFAGNAAVEPQGKARAIAGRMVKQLGLTKNQVQQIRDIAKNYRQDAGPILKSGATPDQKKAQIKELRGKSGDAIMALLNADQKAKAEKMHLVGLLLEPRARVRAGLMAMLAKLGLSEEQKTSIKGIMEEAKPAAKAIRDNTSMDKAAKKAQFVQLRKSTKTKIMAVLTLEQRNQLKKMLAGAKQRVRGKKGA